ncbi:hypothetical protein HELRODRAFT_183044 [Helobdella robusta]|uniref:Uncharacterized protein n=1 Tax=Helobdella robusta TaxID=6412 RepID=T1FJ36_HELRO|nr:hypothetical protein HELRODRAFT_183044 [Helobdella robusta]ESN89923.1 hypothetical protein HELRODRAFT_183044 [Helobdella robusta]
MDEEKPEIYTRILRSTKRRKTEIDNDNSGEASQTKDKISSGMSIVGDDTSFQKFPQLSINVTPLAELQDRLGTPSSSSSIRPKLIRTKKSLGIGTTSATAAADIANLGIFDELKENSCEEVRMEDLYNIYLNKLWQSQIPVNKKLETIWEDDVEVKRPKRAAYRFISFKSVVSRKKNMTRRAKAIKNGWKVVTQKRLLELEEELKKFMETDVS